MQRLKIEILQEIQTSISQLENGMGVAHNDAKEMILKSMANGQQILPADEIYYLLMKS